MKKILKFTMLSAVLLGLAGWLISCDNGKKECEIIYCVTPTDMKPIDWEDYNDVYTTYWYFTADGSGPWGQFQPFKISGRVPQMDLSALEGRVGCFYLYDYYHNDEPYIEEAGRRLIRIPVSISDSAVADSLYHKFVTADLTKKCYIRGRLLVMAVDSWSIDYCYRSPLGFKHHCISPTGLIVSIEVFSADDIYFE
jgi:hypothetical protein